MKKVYGSHDPLLIGQLREVLEAQHIGCITRNDYLMGAAGELPPTECWPEIWVLDDAQAERARALVDAFLAAAEAPGGPWRCPRCEEALDGAFSQCWRCGYERPPWEGGAP
jgi:hypothetical protein